MSTSSERDGHAIPEEAALPAPPSASGEQALASPPEVEVGARKDGGGEFHIPSLDGLRTISFLIVFASHAGLTGIPGGFGVTVFFFLSGYLITTLLRLEYQGSGSISLRDFYLRRVLRILPPFYTVLALASLAVWTGISPGSLRLQPMMALLFHYANYWDIAFGTDGQPPGTGVYWSLAVEEHFYFVFPGVFILLQRAWPDHPRKQSATLLFLCALVLVWRTCLVYVMGDAGPRTFLATDTRLDSILFGCTLAIGANPMLDAPRLPNDWLLERLLPAGLALLVLSFVVRDERFRESLRYTLQALGLVPVFVAAMRAPRWGPFRLLNRKLIKKLGGLSYSLYLVHQVVLYAIELHFRRAPTLVRALAALAISIVLSWLIQRAIERPCARIRRRLAHASWLTAGVAKASAARAAVAAESSA